MDSTLARQVILLTVDQLRGSGCELCVAFLAAFCSDVSGTHGTDFAADTCGNAANLQTYTYIYM